MAIILPTAAQAALQTPLNTFSPTSTPLTNTVNSLTYNYNSTLGIWTSAATGSGLAAASLTEAAAGVLTSVYSSPQTSVPKDASGMTGAALIPGGNDAARPTSTSLGMFRYNTQTGLPATLEWWDGTTWAPAGSFPVGTTMPFAQATAPLGWTQVVSATYNDASIRLVTGAGGGTGGSIAFSSLFSTTATYNGSMTITAGSVGNTTLTSAQLASHTHGLSGLYGYYNQNFMVSSGVGGTTRLVPGNGGVPNAPWPTDTDSTGSDSTHTHSLAGVVASGAFTSDFSVKYVNMIVATKT